jgi:hypothetical protein
MKKRELKEMEYPDAECGYVRLYNYKEPFLPFKGGFGYEGTLLFDGETEKIQCHLCGNWFHTFSNHLNREHNMRASAYKNMVGLRQSTALVAESARKKMVLAKFYNPSKNLRPGKKHSEATKKKIAMTLLANPMETKNEKGTCPLQLLDRLNKLSQRLGRVPTEREVPFKNTLYKVFGSYSKACKRAGLEGRKSGQNLKHWKTKGFDYTNAGLIKLLREFKDREGRYPSFSDTTRGLLPTWEAYKKHFGGWDKARDLAFPNEDWRPTIPSRH